MAKRNTKAKCFICCSVSYTHWTMEYIMECSLVVYMLSDIEMMREKTALWQLLEPEK